MGAIAYDAVDGNLTEKIKVDGVDDVDLSKPGEYTITYTVLDEQDNEGMAERTVIVKDTTEPVIILNGIGSIAEINVSDKGFNYLDANVIIQGDGEGASAIAVLANGFISSIQLLDPGFGYTSANVIIEGSGVGAKADAVLDNGLHYFVEADSDPELNFEDPGYSALDSLDGDLTDAVVVNGADEVDLAATGDYTIIYEVEDAAAQGTPRA